MNGTPANIALYWDFENMHASLVNIERGPDSYYHNRYRKQESVLDVGAIMDYVNGLGAVNINKAFANWSFLHAYSYSLQENAVDLIQLFPKGSHGKNGADIRMSIEVVEDLASNPHIDVVVIVGGDSDYIAVAQKVRSKGKRIIGIGVKESTNAYWVKSCNEFKFYSTLLKRALPGTGEAPAADDDLSFDEAKALLVKAMKHLLAASSNQRVARVSIKPVMLRLDPAFDERDVGFDSFTGFLRGCADVVQVDDSDGECFVSLRSGEAKEPSGKAHQYEAILKSEGIRLVNPSLLDMACTITPAIFAKFGTLASPDEYPELLNTIITDQGVNIEPSGIKKINALFFNVCAFEAVEDPRARGLGLSSWVTDAETLRTRVLTFLVERIVANAPEGDLDFAAIAELLVGDSGRADEMRKLAQGHQPVEPEQTPKEPADRQATV